MTSAELSGLNAGYVAQMFEAYLDAPASVPDEWRRLFENDPGAFAGTLPGLAGLLREAEGNGAAARRSRATGAAAPPPPAPRLWPRPSRPWPSPSRTAPPPATEAVPEAPPPGGPQVDETLLGGVAAAMALVKAYRMHGHLAARLDPLGSEPMGDPALDESRLVPSLTPELQARIPASVLRLYVEGETLADALPKLKAVYTGSIAYEIEHISDHAERVWLRQAIESGRFRQPLDPEERHALLHRLSQAEGFEQYLRRSFLGQKQFSLEGLDDARADARRGDRARGCRRGARGRDRDGSPGAAERPRAHRRALVPVDPARVRGRALDRRARRRPGGRHRRRQVPPAGVRHARDGVRRDRRHDRPQPEPPRGGRPGRRGPGPGRADRPLERRGRPRPVRRPAGAHPRGRGVPRPGRRRGDAQSPVARGLRDGRHPAPDHEQPGRLHDRSRREPLHPLLERPREGLRRADRPRQRRRSRGGTLRDQARSGLPNGVRARLRDRPRRLPALRAQRAGRRLVHAAADGRADPEAADGARGVCRPARRGGCDHGGGGRRARGRRDPDAARRRTSSSERRSARRRPLRRRPGRGSVRR